MSYQIDNEVNDKVRKNVHYSLAIRLRDLTSKTKKLEKELVMHLPKPDQDDLENNNLIDFDDDDDGQVNQLEVKKKQQQISRTKEIEELVGQTKDLAAMFKELSVLVIEQGTILDRIDYNVETALVSTKKGKKHLEGAKKASESTRARNIIL